MKSWPFTLRIRHRFVPLPDCRWPGRQRNRCCTRRSVRSGLRPGRRSIGRCWPAPNRTGWKAAPRCGSTARSPAALMHEPSDSALLWDAVRVMTRLLRQAAALPGAPALQWRDRRRLAKKRARAIEYSRGHDNRRRLYRELIAATRATQAAVQQAAEKLADLAGIAAERWRAPLGHYLPLIERILAQSQRRVLDGQTVPASEKLVSLFEPHADIIVKGARDVQYGHKLN